MKNKSLLNSTIFIRSFMIMTFFMGINACTEKSIALEFPFEGEKIKVLGLFGPDAVPEIILSQTIDLNHLDQQDFKLSNANAYLFEAGTKVDSFSYYQELPFSGSLYRLSNNFKPKENKTYHVEITNPNLPSIVSMQEAIPAFVAMNNPMIEVDNDMNFANIKFQFEDDLEKDNLYQLQILGQFKIDTLGIDTLITLGSAFIDDDDFHSPNRTIVKNNILLKTFTPDKNGHFMFVEHPEYLILKFYIYSTTYEQYFESVDDYDEEIGGFFQGNPFITTNIQGGYGIWAGYQLDSIRINF